MHRAAKIDISFTMKKLFPKLGPKGIADVISQNTRRKYFVRIWYVKLCMCMMCIHIIQNTQLRAIVQSISLRLIINVFSTWTDETKTIS